MARSTKGVTAARGIPAARLPLQRRADAASRAAATGAPPAGASPSGVSATGASPEASVAARGSTTGPSRAPGRHDERAATRGAVAGGRGAIGGRRADTPGAVDGTRADTPGAVDEGRGPPLAVDPIGDGSAAARMASPVSELAPAVAGERLSVSDGDSTLLLEAHDRQQLEVQFAHAVADATAGEPLELDLYFFIPRNVGLSASNYPRDEFYGDLTAYLRLDLPDLTLEELASDEPTSPLVRLQAHIAAVGRGEGAHQPVAVEVQLFGHSFTEAVRFRYTALVEELRRIPHEPVGRRWALLDEVDRFASVARDALSALRRARRSFEPLGRTAPAVLESFHYTDEYCSLYLDGALARIAASAADVPALFDGSGFVGRLRQMLARHGHDEADYRAAHGFLNLGDGTLGSNAEYFAYRQSFLKKVVQQALYVDTRRLETDRFVRNAVGAVAAGLAATWMLVAQIPSQLQNLPPVAQTFLFALPVAAYVAKDRIKELTREWLATRVRAFDHDLAIRGGSLAEVGLGSISGRVKERVRYLERDELPPSVLALRVARRTIENAALGAEGVMVYGRRLELRSDRATPLARGLALRQIVRLNLRHFLSRLDDAVQREFHYSTAEERFVPVALPKVYHINLIAHVRSGPGPGTMRRWRVVLNKDGIVRLETVTPAGP